MMSIQIYEQLKSNDANLEGALKQINTETNDDLRYSVLKNLSDLSRVFKTFLILASEGNENIEPILKDLKLRVVAGYDDEYDKGYQEGKKVIEDDLKPQLKNMENKVEILQQEINRLNETKQTNRILNAQLQKAQVTVEHFKEEVNNLKQEAKTAAEINKSQYDEGYKKGKQIAEGNLNLQLQIAQKSAEQLKKEVNDLKQEAKAVAEANKSQYDEGYKKAKQATESVLIPQLEKIEKKVLDLQTVLNEKNAQMKLLEHEFKNQNLNHLKTLYTLKSGKEGEKWGDEMANYIMLHCQASSSQKGEVGETMVHRTLQHLGYHYKNVTKQPKHQGLGIDTLMTFTLEDYQEDVVLISSKFCSSNDYKRWDEEFGHNFEKNYSGIDNIRKILAMVVNVNPEIGNYDDEPTTKCIANQQVTIWRCGGKNFMHEMRHHLIRFRRPEVLSSSPALVRTNHDATQDFIYENCKTLNYLMSKIEKLKNSNHQSLEELNLFIKKKIEEINKHAADLEMTNYNQHLVKRYAMQLHNREINEVTLKNHLKKTQCDKQLLTEIEAYTMKKGDESLKKFHNDEMQILKILMPLVEEPTRKRQRNS